MKVSSIRPQEQGWDDLIWSSDHICHRRWHPLHRGQKDLSAIIKLVYPIAIGCTLLAEQRRQGIQLLVTPAGLNLPQRGQPALALLHRQHNVQNTPTLYRGSTYRLLLFFPAKPRYPVLALPAQNLRTGLAG
ncbi:Uncharacterised protein [Salmonella enterica subsp. enterica serovar Typhi]|nr:Uncharacterised protein [Salmonella enterica subsp. enterica serovar Typhi]